MSEQRVAPVPTPPRPAPPASSAGAPPAAEGAVAEVLAEVESLEQRPLDEHVAVLTSAQQRLRAALDPDA